MNTVDHNNVVIFDDTATCQRIVPDGSRRKHPRDR